MVESTSDLRVLATELVKRANDETRRTRLLEQRVDRFEAEMERMQGMISAQNSEFKAQLQQISAGIKSLSDRMSAMESAISRIEKELAKRATKGEVKQIESYMSLMSPVVAKFVTKEEMERAIEEKMTKKY
jgi:TolA-binding protein